MAWSNLQPQAPRLRQRTYACPWQSLTPTCVRPDQFRAANTARRHNEAATPHPPPRFPPSVGPSPTSAADQNPHSHRPWPTGSCMRGFRTPAGTRNPSQLQSCRKSRSFTESGHIFGQSNLRRKSSPLKPEIANGTGCRSEAFPSIGEMHESGRMCRNSPDRMRWSRSSPEDR